MSNNKLKLIHNTMLIILLNRITKGEYPHEIYSDLFNAIEDTIEFLDSESIKQLKLSTDKTLEFYRVTSGMTKLIN